MKLRFNLFWKIFLWLWLTLILFIAVHFILMGYSRDRIHIEPLSDSALADLQHQAERQATRPFRERPPAPHMHRRFHGLPPDGRHEEPRRLELFFLNNQGNDIRGRPLAQALALLHNRYLESGRPGAVYQQQDLYMGPVVINRDGEMHYVYSHRHLRGLGQEHIRMIWSQIPKNLLLSAVLITFPVCFALAWYLSSPIRRLQQATHEFSATRKVPAQIAPLQKRGDEFGDLARDFSRMAARVQNTLESQKRLLSDVSHELRSPLARLRIALGLVQQKTADEPGAYRKELDQMILECERIDSLIGQLLDLARLDRGSSNTETTSFDLCELILDIKHDAELEAGQKNLTLRTSLPDSQPMKGVPEILRAGVENVLRNALRHAPIGSEIDIRLSACETSQLLTIRDRGPGVDTAHIDKIFEPFYRPQYARERDSGGSGLGLAIAKRAIEYHGGTIQAENAADGGLQVNIRLPGAPEKDSPVHESPVWQNTD